jgi:hypothetical protein
MQSSIVHLLRLFQPALAIVKVAQVVDRGKRLGVVRASRLLLPLQRSIEHLLCLFQPALVGEEMTTIMPCPLYAIPFDHILLSNVPTSDPMLDKTSLRNSPLVCFFLRSV